MKIKGSYLCRCGHSASAHTHGVFRRNIEEAEINRIIDNSKGWNRHSCNSNCDKFELQNLDLIEYLAEERGLI